MDRDEIKAQLHKMPIEASVAFAVRVGLRVLPWLAQPKAGQPMARWLEIDRAKHLFAVLQVYDVGLMVACAGKPLQLQYFSIGSRIANAPNALNVANAIQYAVAVYDDTGAVYAPAVGYAVSSAVRAYEAVAADAAEDAYGDIIKYLKLSGVSDLSFLRNNGVKKLLESPLWPLGSPPAFIEQLSRFQTAVRWLASGFDLWLDWYDARCRGDAIDVKQLEARVFLPASISDQSPQVINAYLTSLLQDDVAGPLNRVRTIFIGDGEAGKTSLIRVLNNEPVVEGIELKTPGIEIREWPVPGTDIKVSFWDFGGQVMVHATHQLFLRESCLYVLLVSAREKEKATERAEYWLEHVKSFGKGAPVLIVANKADKEPVRLDESLLLEKYPGMIKGFFQLACTEAQGSFRNQFEQFRQAFCLQLQAVGLHQVQFQKAHFAVLQNLRQRTPKQAFLTHQDYDSLCAEHRVDEHGALDRAWLLDILDKLGVIIHFPDIVEMDEYILNPRWLTYGVYALMYNEQARITRAQAVQLLAAKPVKDLDGNELSYPKNKCNIVFEAMRRYKLCYFLPRDPDQIIIPALLPSDIKQHGFDMAKALEFHYQFESFLPRHLISELIVECHEDIASRNIAGIETDIVWQHGVLLINPTHRTQALIQADYHFRRLSIWLTGSSAAADFLAVLRDRVERIVSRIDIKYQQNIRLPREALLPESSNPPEPEWASFRQILVLREKQQATYFHESGTEYSVSAILGLFASEVDQSAGGNTIYNISNSIVRDLIHANKDISGSLNGKE
jgi:GTPase SAR1 family protein